MSGIHRPHLAAILLLLLPAAVCCAQIPDHIGDWRVEVGPAGNEYCLAPERPVESPRLPDRLLSIVRALAPSHADVTSWRLVYDGTYWITAEAEPDRYEYRLAPNGAVREITYTNTSTRAREVAYALTIKDTRKSIPLKDVPPRALETLARAVPGAAPRKAWVASTTAGTRYLLAAGKTIFYARPDGQIQSARLVSEGALEENYPEDADRDSVLEGIRSETAELLGAYRDRFNFDHQIRRLESRSPGRGGRFRFVVMGDSRSNYDLWSNMLKHISRLDPRPEFIINTGDLVPRGLAKEYRDYLVPPLLKSNIPFFVAIGNHDYGFERKALEYRYLFGDDALNYYFDYGGYRFIFVDNCSDAAPLEKTVDWLGGVLAGTPAGFRTIVVFHDPFGNIEKWAYHALPAEQSKPFTDLMTRFKVDHVFCGHIHAYSTATFGGIDYTITGGGGAPLQDRFGPLGSVYHYVLCDVEADGTLKQQVVRFYRNAAR